MSRLASFPRALVASLSLCALACSEAPVTDEASAPAIAAVTVSPVVSLVGAQTEGTHPAFGDQLGSAAGSFDATNALVAYVESIAGAPTLAAMRIDATGARVGDTFRLASGVRVTKPAVACNAAYCLVVFASADGIVGVRVDPTGTVLDASPIAFGLAMDPIFIAAHDDGAGVTVAWSDRASNGISVRARRMSVHGAPLGFAPAMLAQQISGGDLSVGSAAGISVIAWDETPLAPGGRIAGARLDASGAVLDTAPLTLVNVTTAMERKPRIASRGSELVIIYFVRDVAYARTMTVSPVTVGPEVYLAGIYADHEDLAISADGTSFVLSCLATDLPPIWYAITVGTIPSSLTHVTPVTWFDRLDAISSVAIVQMSEGRVVVASLRTDRPPGPFTNGFDVQSARSLATRRNLTLGGASAREPSATYTPSSAQFGVVYLEDAAFTGYGVRFARVSASGAALDAAPRIAATGNATSTWVTRFDSPRATTIGPFHQLFYRKRSEDNSPPYDAGVVEGMTFDSASPPTAGILRTFNDVLPNGAASGGDFVTLYRQDFGLRDRRITTSTDTYGQMMLSGLPNVRAEGQRGIAWSDTQLAVLTPGVATATKLSIPMLDDAGPGVANGTRSTLVVRRATGGQATEVLATLLDAGATSISRPTFVASSGAELVSPARVVFDGTNYDVVFVRGRSVEIVRVSEDGTWVDTASSVLATDAFGTTRAPAVATDRAGRVLVAYERFDESPGVRALRIAVRVVDWNGVGGHPLGTPCSGAIECASGRCIDGVCCNASCGLAQPDDCQACSVAAGGAEDGTCGPVIASARVCRASAGACDVAEVCDGVSAACPTDALVEAGTLCGALGRTPCEGDQRCTGDSATCPLSAPSPSTVVCRAATGECDVAERCTGSSITCPADGVAGPSTVCRSSAGPCDRADTCDGATKACGADLREPQTTACRASQGPCDLGARCDGSGATCPNSAPAAANVVCRAAVQPCDVSESCNGFSTACPADRFALASVVCRAAAGECDVADTCTGTGPGCPSENGFAPSGTVCRPAAGVCDVAEVCTGNGPTCPNDARRPRGYVCRASEGICGVAETCSGGAAECPVERHRIDGSRCDDGLVCNGAEICEAGACVAGEPLVCEAPTPCLESTGECSVPERAGGCGVTPSSETPPFGALTVFVLVVCIGWLRSRRASVAAVALVSGATLVGCVCGVGRVSCESGCVDIDYDERNCGACGNRCGYGQCIEGECHALPATPTTCDTDEVCTDGNVCNGVERCANGRCRRGADVACDDGLTCTLDSCSSELGTCVSIPTTPTCGLSP